MVKFKLSSGQPVKQREPTFAIFKYSSSKVKSLIMGESPTFRDAPNTIGHEEESEEVSKTAVHENGANV